MELKIAKETAKCLYLENREYFREIEKELSTPKKKEWNEFETFDDLCRVCGTDEIEFNKKWDPTIFDPSTIAFERLKICTRAYNQDWPFNTYDTNQRKYYPWFIVSSSGLGFSGSDYGCDYARTDVGSRLCFESEEKADHAGKTFLKLFEEFITAKY